MKKNKQKNTQQYLASFQALKYSNISTFDSGIQKFEHFNIRTLVTRHIMKAYESKMAHYLFISDVGFSIEEDLSTLLVKEYDLKTHIKGYHV